MSSDSGTSTNPWSSIKGLPLTCKPIPVVTAVSGGTLTPQQSGSIVVLPITAANATLTLPAAAIAQGCQFQFVVGGTLTHTWRVSSPAANVYGMVWTQATTQAATLVVAGGSTNINVTATGIAGDQFSVFSDGTNWYVNGTSCNTAAASFAAFS